MIAPRSLFCERHLPAWRKLVMGSGAFHVVEICLNCGERTTQNYIPKKNVVERWPKGWLCRLCHAEWHRRVTPAMSQGRPLEGAAD